MSQITTGIRKCLEVPSIYSLFQSLIGARAGRDHLLNTYIQLQDGMRVIDVGCGPADILDQIPQKIVYYGFDFEQAYIDKAKATYGERGQFICQDVAQFDFSTTEKFDRVLVFALLHHLDDTVVESLLKTLSTLLKPNGFLFCIENVFVPDQTFLARKIIERDRGQNVRTTEGYLNLVKPWFSSVDYEIRHDLLRIPYTHILMTCYPK